MDIVLELKINADDKTLPCVGDTVYSQVLSS
jgi:hypothetical protein